MFKRIRTILILIACGCLICGILTACGPAGSGQKSGGSVVVRNDTAQAEEDQGAGAGTGANQGAETGTGPSAGMDTSTGQGKELTEEGMFSVLEKPELLWDSESYTAKTVYADFVIKDLREHVEPLHGDITIFVTVESKFGKEYTLKLDPIRTQCELKIGREYTIFISYFNRDTLIIDAFPK